jgi:hypothetical protein
MITTLYTEKLAQIIVADRVRVAAFYNRLGEQKAGSRQEATSLRNLIHTFKKLKLRSLKASAW